MRRLEGGVGGGSAGVIGTEEPLEDTAERCTSKAAQRTTWGMSEQYAKHARMAMRGYGVTIGRRPGQQSAGNTLRAGWQGLGQHSQGGLAGARLWGSVRVCALGIVPLLAPARLIL